MGNTCYSAPKTELDQHIDKYHKNRRAPAQQPYHSNTQFTSHEDLLEQPGDVNATDLQKQEKAGYESRIDSRPVQRMSRLLEPIAVQRQQADYLERVDNEGWVTVDPNAQNDQSVKYKLNERVKTPARQANGPMVAGQPMPMDLVHEEMPAGHEKENLDILEMLKTHTNKSVSQSSGPSLRALKLSNGEVIETFPIQKSLDMAREKVELIEVVEASLQPEIGTGGAPRNISAEPVKFDYAQLDLYSEQVLSEEILFQGRLNKFQAGFKNTFNPKWVVVTRSAFRYYKNMEASVQNPAKPLLVLPMVALERCERVNFDLGLNKQQSQQQSDFLVNQFEVFLKDDFLPLYLQPRYEAIMQRSGANQDYASRLRQSTQLSARGASVQAMATDIGSKVMMGVATTAAVPSAEQTAAETHADEEERLLIAKFKAVSINEKVENLAQKSSKNISTQGSWSNREEEWYFVNKRLLFATQSSNAADTWVLNLNQLMAQVRIYSPPEAAGLGGPANDPLQVSTQAILHLN